MNTWYLQTFIPIQRIAQKLRFALFHNIFYETNMLYFCKLWNHKGYVNWVHKDTTIEKMDGCNWCRQITDLFQFIHARNQGGFIINNYDISLLQFLFCKNTVNLKEWVAPLALLFCYSSMDGCNWNCELSQYFWKRDDCKCLFQRNTVLLKTVGHCKRPSEIMMVLHKCMAASSPLK